MKKSLLAMAVSSVLPIVSTPLAHANEVNNQSLDNCTKAQVVLMNGNYTLQPWRNQ